MSAFEYLLLLAAVVLGLALADLAVSVHRLLSARGRVRWDWLAPLAAIVAFLKILTQWWTWFSAESIASSLTFEMFLVVLVASLLLFLLAATALPDDFGEGAVDLRDHYALVSRRFWLLFVSQWLLMQAVRIWAGIVINKAHVDLVSPVWLVVPVALSLAFIRNRWWHTVGLLGFVALYLVNGLGHVLTA
jgi:hypothetical protein